MDEEILTPGTVIKVERVEDGTVEMTISYKWPDYVSISSRNEEEKQKRIEYERMVKEIGTLRLGRVKIKYIEYVLK